MSNIRSMLGKVVLLSAFFLAVILIKPAVASAYDQIGSSPLFQDSLTKSVQQFSERSQPVSSGDNALNSGGGNQQNGVQLVGASTFGNCVPNIPTMSGVTCGTTCKSTCGATCGSTCGSTCISITCRSTCTATCQGSNTCSGFATCAGSMTCSGSPTCKGSMTCAGYVTCSGSVTCTGSPTCKGTITCSGYATCAGSLTCSSSPCTTPTPSPSPNPSPEPDIPFTRLYGNNRYGTSAQIALDGWPEGSDYAVLATGENYPDALGAAPLAKKYDAPLLLTEKNALNQDTAAALEALNVTQVFIVGGTGVISPNVETALEAMGIAWQRIAGGDRSATAVEVAKQLGDCREAFLAVGDDFPDALSVGPIAACRSAPVLLTARDELPESVRQYLLSRNLDKIYVIGSGALISDQIIAGLPQAERINGDDIYARNANVINRFREDLSIGKPCVATGKNFPDALSGSAYAAFHGRPIILVSNPPAAATKDFVRENRWAIDAFQVFGGEAVVPADIFSNSNGYFQ